MGADVIWNSDASLNYWQVFDRTTNKEVPAGQWVYHPERKEVEITNIVPWHRYSVSFLVYRIWEEISMYNHVTNHWDKEHLLPIAPRYKETQEYLLDWMENWCREHPHTTVVRFTSLFYNFVWIWGSDVERRNLFTDWASYDFTVSPEVLDEFAEKYGYRLTAEDFTNQGKLHVTHMPADQKKRDYMELINDFVIDFGKRFPEFGFDGIIKAVFSGFEARLCGGVNVSTHELKLHPYLFPTGVDGSPSFLEDGNPTEEAGRYWVTFR